MTEVTPEEVFTVLNDIASSLGAIAKIMEREGVMLMPDSLDLIARAVTRLADTADEEQAARIEKEESSE